MNTNTQEDNFAKVMISIAVMLVAILEVMDVTIINVALPNMMGSLGANAEQISWVLTSYIVSSAIVMLLTGFLVERFGRKRLLIISILGFLISSCLCGMSGSITQMVAFRILQGMFGATLVPISQYILRDTYPPEKQGVAMAIWGIGIMVAPIFGPTLGGIITDTMSWRWTFYVNVPISFIALVMCVQFVRETPTKRSKIDFAGLILMILGVGSLQIFLDQGNNENWFASTDMLILFIFSVITLTIFIARGIQKQNHILNFQLFRDPNFTLSTIIITLFCASGFGIIVLQPMMLESLFNYSPTLAGMVVAPRGFACAIGLMCVAKLVETVDFRLLIAIGLSLCATGSWIMSQFSLAISPSWVVTSCLVQGLGMGMVFVPVSTMTTMTLPASSIAEATGIFNFGRSLGTSIGISMLITLLTRTTQTYWHTLGGHIHDANPALHIWLNQAGLSLQSPHTAQILGLELHRQASMLGFIECYRFSTYLFVAMLPLLLLVRHKSDQKPRTGLQSN